MYFYLAVEFEWKIATSPVLVCIIVYIVLVRGVNNVLKS